MCHRQKCSLSSETSLLKRALYKKYVIVVYKFYLNVKQCKCKTKTLYKI